MNRIQKTAGIVMASCMAVSCGNPAESYSVTQQTFNEAVYASGELFPETYHILKSSVSDRILKLAVEEGDSVQKGDVLAILGTPTDSDPIQILENLVAVAKSNAQENSASLAELQNKITLAKEQYEHDEQNADRYNELLQSKAVSQKDARQVAMLARTSLAHYQNLQQQYRMKKNELANRLLDAERQLSEARQSRQTKVLTSPVSGRVYNIVLKEGELAESNQAILMVGSPGRYKLELWVDERDISKIALGQKVFFQTDAFKDEPFEAIIARIDPVLQKGTGSFKVEARVESGRNFYPQSSVEANIMIREKTTALMIPADYLLKDDCVWCRSAKGERMKVNVKVGSRSGHFIEIIDGLKAGDNILKEQ